jgi:hypothetical protein
MSKVRPSTKVSEPPRTMAAAERAFVVQMIQQAAQFIGSGD